MGNHRAPRRGAQPAVARTTAPAQETPYVGGKRRAAKPQTTRSPLVKVMPSPAVLVGVAALAVSATGAVTVSQADLGSDATASSPIQLQASALSGVSAVSASTARASRTEAISRDSRRDALEDATNQEIEAAAEAAAEQRNAELAKLAATAEKHRDAVELNLWHLPLASYRLTATFGQAGGNWSRNHTGLDFAAPTGTPVMAVANGTVTSAEYAGAYGNQIIVTTDDGTELWFCHLSGYAVSVGDTVRAGEVIGYVGSTGNSTGPHMHLEVRPGAGDPVDPMAALIANGVRP
ncbi:Peptidase M23 domain-containing protein [Nocardioides dubius]|uniref:M23ase beta-sheet core domain-containing protein n=1 Tax=Nocardioides dubius TaxID=317019 RepID=A0ABP4EQG1_9ACTN